MFLILAQIILIIIYYCKSLYSIRKYIFNISEKYILYLSIVRNNILLSHYNSSLSLKDNFINYNAPPKKRIRINGDIDKIPNIKKNDKKGKTRIEKKKNTRNIIKRITFKPKNDKINNINMENNYQNISKNSNSNYKNNNNNLIDSSKSNYQLNNGSKNKSKRTTKIIKNYLDDKFINSKEQLNKNKISNPSIYTYNQNNLMTNPKNENNINIEEYLSTEPDDMDYDDAIKRDNRKFCQFFYDKLKVNQMILNTFFIKDPLRPRPLKIILFLLDIDLYLFINGLFFNEDYISQMLHVSSDEGIIPFIERFLDRFFYITLAGVIISYIIECFFVDEKKNKRNFKKRKR